MSDAPSNSQEKQGVSAVLVVIGVLFIVAWLATTFVLGVVALPALLMANDSGAHPDGQHMKLIGGTLGSLLMLGASGVPAGLAMFWRGWRKGLLWTFAVLFGGGGVMLWSAIRSYF